MSISTITATCPVTSKEIFPLANAPSDWAGGGRALVVTCPACGGQHEWRPQQGTLTIVADANGKAAELGP